MTTVLNTLAPDSVALLRADLWTMQYRPVAVTAWDSERASPGKRPRGLEWQVRARRNPPDDATAPASASWPNTGILADELQPIDIDFEDSAAVRALAVQYLGETIERTRANSGRSLMLYRAAVGSPAKRMLATSAGKIEVLGHGQQFVAFGRHASGAMIEWRNGSPLDTPYDFLPEVTEDQISAFLAAVRDLVGDGEITSMATNARTSKHGLIADPERVASAVACIPNTGPANWDRWSDIGREIHAATGGSDDGLDIWESWSEQHPEHGANASCAERWEHWHASPNTAAGYGKLAHRAKEADPSFQATPGTGGAEFDGMQPEAAAAPEAIGVDELTEDCIGQAFAERYANRFRFDATAGGKGDRAGNGAWFHFIAGHGWVKDETGLVPHESRLMVRQLRRQRGFAKDTMSLATDSFRNAVLRMAAKDQAMVMTHDRWDADPWLLGVPGGQVDLHTGEFSAARPEHYIRRRTSVAPAPPGTPSPLWTRVLLEATGGDREYIAWLQRLAGYLLTGDVSEEIFAFVYGKAKAGKGTIFGTMGRIMAAHRYSAPTELFRASNLTSSTQQYQLAKFEGIRAVFASETDYGQHMAESLIKEITGNENKLNARHPYGEPFEFHPRCKIVIIGNFAPKLVGRTDSMERRMRVVPFNNPPAEADTTLKERLVAEFPGILRWMIDGCLIWQRERLGWCSAVKAASTAFFEEQDTIVQWADERCDRDPATSGSATALLEDFNTWLRQRGDRPFDAKTFKDAIRDRLAGVAWRHTKTGKVYDGLTIKKQNSPDWAEMLG